MLVDEVAGRRLGSDRAYGSRGWEAGAAMTLGRLDMRGKGRGMGLKW